MTIIDLFEGLGKGVIKAKDIYKGYRIFANPKGSGQFHVDDIAFVLACLHSSKKYIKQDILYGNDGFLLAYGYDMPWREQDVLNICLTLPEEGKRDRPRFLKVLMEDPQLGQHDIEAMVTFT